MKVSHALGLLLGSLGLCAFSWMAGCSSSDESDGGTDGGKDGSGEGGTGGTAGTTGPTTGTTDTPPTCDEYCDLAIKSCQTTGTFSQWANKPQCLLACEALPAGNGGETAGNSVSCRTYHSGVAGQPGEQATHCPHTGFSGGGACGDRCEAFCKVASSLCVAPLPQPFASEAACIAACGKPGGFPGFDNATASAGEYAASESAKNNLNCRQYWLWEALKDPNADAGATAAPNCARLGLPNVTDGGLTPACVN